jgi:hypothetical protein
MKRRMAILSVVGALALTGAATVPASAGTIEPFQGVKVTCQNQSNPTAAKYTVTVQFHTRTYTFSFTLPGKTCPF